MRLFPTSITLLLSLLLVACATPKTVKQESSTTNQHLKAASMAAAAYYQNPQTRKDLLAAQGLTEVQYVGLKDNEADGKETEYLIAEQGKTLYICFTGSNEKKDFLALYGKYESYQGTTYPVHQGFVKAWEEAESDILTLAAQKKPTSVFMCGHSKGGSVASAAALKMMAEGYNVVEVTTFGSPPIFKIPRDESDNNFKAKIAASANLARLNSISTHYIREYDYVQIASTGLARNNRSIGNQLTLKDDGTLYSGTSYSSAAMGALTNTASAKVEKVDSAALHHHASSYLELLKKAK